MIMKLVFTIGYLLIGIFTQAGLKRQTVLLLIKITIIFILFKLQNV